MKQNDWIVANINNPEFTESDFKNIQGLTLDNTQLLPFESYLNSKFITENDKFKGNDGLFNKDKFEEFYKNQASKFGEFQKNGALDNYEYGFWDIYQKPDSKIQNPNFNLETTLNPEHISTGVIGPNMQGERSKSIFELAEKQKIFDWETGKYKDLTPEDSALFTNPIRFVQNLFSDPLVLAEYEQDEIDPVTGEQHYKGDKKLNDQGEYYFETLGGRSLVGKKVLSLGDVLTKEDSFINKYDFFDSDDLEKSIGGTITKNIAAIAPMALLGPTGAAWYSGFYVAREIAKSLPMLNNILTMWSDDNDDPKLLNTIAGIGEKFTGGTSEYSKNQTFSFENFGNLIADVALQWGQQKLIANSISKVKGNTNAIVDAAETKAAVEYEKRAQEIWNRANNGEMIEALRYTNATSFDDITNAISSGRWKTSSVGVAAMQKFVPEAQKAFSKQAQLGQDLSLIYMSIISNYDVYNDAIEHGATKSEAAAVALGSTLGMFSVDKYAHLGEIFFDETPEKMALRNLRQGIKEEAQELTKKIGTKEINDTSKKGLIGLMQQSAKRTSDFIRNYQSGLKNHTLGFFGKAFGEGLEEMSEEAVTDLTKSLYQLAGQFGYVSQTDIGAWDNMRERYLMSLFGGAIGGGLFYGVDAIRNPKNTVDQNIQKELLYLVSQGKTSDILENLEDMRSKGKLASKDLSIDTTDDENGNKVFITADENHKSQNDYVYDIMKNSILQMESIINEHSLNLNDDQLFEKMVLSNQRYMALKNNLFDKSYITQYYDDFQQIVSDVYNIEKQIQDLKDSTKDENKREENSNYQEKLKNLEEQKKELLKRKESFLKGEYNLDYVDKMLFYIHPEVNGAFYSSLYEQWVQEKYHKDVKDLSEGEKKKYSEEWIKLKKTQGKQYLDKAFNLYKQTRTNVESGLSEVNNDDVLKWGELLKQLNETSPENQGLKPDDRIPSKQVDIDSFLDSVNVVKTAEYDKPWRNDPSKTNKAFQLQLVEDSSAAFEIVKDHEDGYWSIHFKTPRTLTTEQKQRLFQAAAAVIPEGDKLSTWGELTKGGISGINRFGQLDFLGGIEFEQVGTRQVKTKPITSGKIDRTKYTPAKADIASRGEKEYIITNEQGLEIPLYGNTSQLKVTFKDGSTGYIHTGAIDPDILIQNNEVQISDEAGGTLRVNPNDIIKVEDGNQIVSELTTSQENIEIPIWQKTVTGETDEDYNDRNTQREGESDEDFKARKKARANKIAQYNRDNFIKSVKKFLNVNDIIDRSTYRRLIAQLGARRSDVLKWIIKNSKSSLTPGIVTVANKKQFNAILEESLQKLHPDMSNRDEIVQEILSKTRNLRRKEFNDKNKYRKVEIDESKIPDGLILDDEDTITFDSLVYAISDVTNSKVSLSENLTPEQQAEGYITLEQLKDLLYIIPSEEDNVLFNQALENAIKVHNLQLDGASEESIQSIKDSMAKQNYKKLDSTGEEIDTDRLFLSDNDYTFEQDETIAVLDSQQERELNNLIDEIESDSDLQTLNELHRKATIDLNPVIKVLKAVLPKLGEDFGDVEETLESIYNQFESLEIPTSFTLSPQQLAALEKIDKYFNYIWAVVKSAKTKSTYFDFLPYNKSLNSFIDDNKDVIKGVEKLLEMDEDLANVIEQSFAHFGQEIKQWISRSKQGTINKREMFSKFDQKFNKARLDFFNQIKDQCKIGEKDLFKGFEHIDVDKPDAIVEIEKLVYNNFKKQGWTESDLVSIINKQVKVNNVIKQDSGFNKSLDSDFVFTDYDKFIFLTSLVASDPVDFYEFYKGYVQSSKGKNGQKIAPLTFQEYNIKLGFIHKNAMSFINKVLEEFAKQNNMKANILKNTVIISGIAGVGKTDVVVRALQESDSVWVSGPSETQIDSLKQIIPHAQTYGHKELFNAILGQDQYSEILSEISESTSKKLKDEKSLYSGKYIISEKGKEYCTLTDKIKFNIKDAPKQLVIDEITLFSNVELQLLSKWAEKSGTQLIFAGDTHQNGNKSLGFNIQPDYTFAFRTPEMKISLRDANIWKYKNQQAIIEQIDEIERFGNAERSKKYLSNFNFHYYLTDDKFTGEIVTDQLDNKIIKNLSGTIAFIGDTSSANYQKLKGLGKNIEIYDSVDKIQGKEFDYVISDIDLTYTPIDGYSENYNLQTYLNTLYTIITRSKNGTVLIDNGLSKSIKGSVQEQYSNNNIGINPEITEQYVTEKINFLNSLNLTREVPIEPKEEPLTEDTVIEGEEFEEEEKEPEKDEEPDTEDDSYLDVEAEQETITPVFGNINLSGLIRDPNTGKLRKSGNRDLGIFLKDGTEIDVKDRPLQSLFQLKSLIHFDKIDEFWYSQLNSQIRELFTLEQLQNIKYYVSAEDYDPEIHRLLTKEAGYEEGKQAFSVNGVEKVFTLIGVIEKDGKQYEITLGGLSNPETLRKNANDRVVGGKTIKGTISRIRERASKNSELSDKLNAYADSYLDKVDYYERQLIKLSQKGRWQIKKPSFDRCTRISKMKNKDGSRRYHPLNEYFDQNTSQYVVSPVYTQINRNDGKDDILPGLDDKDKGKPVIFVSAFNLYSPTELADLYAKQKQHPEESYPEVRKIILDPRGITFGDLVNQKVRGIESNDEIKFPFSNTAVAFRMYMSLWNFRARITKFNKAVDKYLKEHNISVSEIERLAIEESKNPGGEEFKQLYDLNNYLEEQGIEQFRLGYSETNGFYSRKINDTTNGTFINYQMALDYQKVIDLLFSNVLDKMITPPSATAIKSIIGKTSDFDKQIAIDTWVRKLSSNREINISLKSDDSEKVVGFSVQNEEIFRSLPLALVNICRNLNFAQQYSEGVKGFQQVLKDDPTMNSWWYVRTKDDSGETEDLDYISITEGLTGGLQETEFTGEFTYQPGIRPYQNNEGSYDRRIINLFELAMHGKVESDEENSKESFPADGTLFKYGIFVDTFTVGKYNDNKAFKAVSTNRGLYRTNAMPSSPVLKIDITEWDGVIEQQEEQPEIKTNSELDRINLLLGTNFSDLSQISLYVSNNLNNIFENAVSSRELLNKVVSYNITDGIYTFKTIKDIIKDKTGLDIADLESIEDESSIRYKFIGPDGEYTLYLNGNEPDIKAPDKVIGSSNEFEMLLNEVSGETISNIESEIEDNDGDSNEFITRINFLKQNYKSLEKKDIMKVIDEIMNILDQVDVKSPELSDLQNKLNKVKCNG